MKVFLFLLFLAASFFNLPSFAQAPDTKGWKLESEGAIIQTSGNTDSQSYSAKLSTSYVTSVHRYLVSGRYLSSRANGEDTAKNWDAVLRYLQELNENWGLFLAFGSEADRFAGFVQRDHADLGARYHIQKRDDVTWFLEFGLRGSRTRLVEGEALSENFGRIYSEYNGRISESVWGKLWLEYLPNLTNADAYRVNSEPSINVMLNRNLALKVAYLVKYANAPLVPLKHTDTSLTTSLVATF